MRASVPGGQSGVDGNAGNLYQLVNRDKIYPASDNRIDEPCSTGALALVLSPKVQPGKPGPPPATQLYEVVELQNAPACKNFDALFGEALIAIRQIMDRRDRAVCEFQCQAHFVIMNSQRGVTSQRYTIVSNDRMPDKMAGKVDEMASLANDPPAADGRILCPVICRDVAGIDGDDHVFGQVERCQKRPHLHHLWREAAIEAHHEMLVWTQRDFGLNLGQVFQSQA